MLGPTLWLTVAIALLAGVLLDAAAAFGRGAVHAAAEHAIEPAMHEAVGAYQRSIGGAPPASAPPPGISGVLAGVDAGTPRFVVTYTAEPTTLTAPSCLADAAPASDAARWLQCNRFVAESRLSLHVSVTVRDAAGALLASRDHYVTLRLFAEPPYSALAGSKDAAAPDPAGADALAVPAHEGDGAGMTGGTTIHVRYECRNGAGSCANAAPPDPEGAARPNVPWQNGNRPGG